MAGHLYVEEQTPESLRPEEKKCFLNLRYSHSYFAPCFIVRNARVAGVVAELIKFPETAYIADFDSLLTEAEKFTQADDKDKFAFFLKTNRELIQKFPASDILHEVCIRKAVGCAAAFFESGFHVDLNESFLDVFYYPLDYAALHLSYGLTDILLKHGADPDKVTCWGYPVDLALEELCHNEYIKEWKPNKSIFKLFYLLCLPELKEPLDTIKLLASHTEQVEIVCEKLIKAGKVIHLTALLMAARERLLVPSAEGGLETTPVGKIFKKLRKEKEQQSGSMIASESITSLPSNPSVESTREKRLSDAYNAVKTLWKAVDVLDRYRDSSRVKRVSNSEVPFDIAHDLLMDAKLVLKLEDVYCDDIKCLRPMLTSKAKVLAKQICSKKQIRSRSSSRPLVGVQKPSMGTSWFSSPLMLSMSEHAFHTWQAAEIQLSKTTEMRTSLRNILAAAMPATRTETSASGFPSSSSMSSFPYRAFHTCQSITSNVMKPAEIQMSLRNVLGSTRVCAPLIWIAKRSVK